MLKISFLMLISVGISMGCNRPWDPPTTTPAPVPTTTPTTTTTDSCNGYFWSNGRFKRCTFTPTTIETTTPTEKECPPNSVLLGNGECLDISTCGGYGRRYKRCTVTTTPNVFYSWNWW